MIILVISKRVDWFVSIDSKVKGNLYQSIIAFNGSEVSEILNNYMMQSEQLKTWFLGLSGKQSRWFYVAAITRYSSAACE